MGKRVIKSISHSSKQKNPKNRQNKTELVFDEKARVNYLTGFRKRKLHRKEQARERLKLEELEEKKRLREQRKVDSDRRIQEYKAAFDLDHLENILPDTQTYDLPNHTVTITEMTDTDFTATGGIRLGANTVGYLGSETVKPTNSEDQVPPSDHRESKKGGKVTLQKLLQKKKGPRKRKLKIVRNKFGKMKKKHKRHLTK